MSEATKAVTITLNGDNYALSPLPWGPLKRFIAACSDESSSSNARGDAVADALFRSLKRKYPDMTIERVEEELLDDIPSVVSALLQASGLEKPQGEAPAATV